MKKFYSGRFRPSNPAKYTGNYNKIEYRSLWERQAFRWCDTCGDVIKWSSEELAIPYRCKTDGKGHIYIPDLRITFSNGETHIIEIKPKNQTIAPKKQLKKTKAYVIKVLMYVKNISKWEAAEEWCKAQGFIFNIWTEDTLKDLGIKIFTG